MSTRDVSQILLILDVVLGIIGIISVATWIAMYRRGMKYRQRSFAIEVVLKILQGEDILWDDLVPIYKKNCNGDTPRYEEGRNIFAEAKRILEKHPVLNSRGSQQRIRDAQRSVPDATDRADQEYGCNFGVAIVMLVGVFVAVPALQSANIWLGVLGVVVTGIPSLFFLFVTLFKLIPRLARHARATAYWEGRLLTKLNQPYR